MQKQTPESFWGRVDKGDLDDCWDWTGSKNTSGYGNLQWHGRVVQAHRVAYWLTYGGDRPETKFREPGWPSRYRRFVLHRCDNRTCCNPRHLFLGSMSANMRDAYKKGRKQQPRSSHANAKLTPEQVRDIRTRYYAGDAKQSELAEDHGVSQRVVSLVVRNESYRDVI